MPRLQYLKYALIILGFFGLRIYVFAQEKSANDILISNSNNKAKVQELILRGDSLLKTAPNKSLSFYKSAISFCSSEQPSGNCYKAIKQIGTAYFYLNKLDSAQFYWTLGLNQLPNDSAKQKANLYNNLGALFIRKGLPDSSIKYSNLSLILNQQLNDSLGEAKVQNNLGSLYRQIGNYQAALTNYHAALTIYKAARLKKEQADALNGLGLTYREFNQTKKALDYLTEAKTLYQNLGLSTKVEKINFNMGTVYYQLNEYQKAEQFYTEFLNAPITQTNKRNMAGALTNLAIINNKQNQKQLALSQYQQALQLFKELNDKAHVAITSLNLGLLYNDMNSPKKAETHLLFSLELATELNNIELRKNANHGLSETYELSDDYKKAYRHLQAYAFLKDTLFTNNLGKEVAYFQEKYQNEKQAREIKELHYKNDLQSKQSTIDRLYALAAITGVVLSLGLLLLLWNRYRLQQKLFLKNEDLLKQENHKIQLENRVKSQELSAQAMNLIHKNELLTGLQNQLQKLKNQEANKTDLSELEKTVKNGLNQEDDWAEFQNHFNAVHPDFFKTLKTRFPKLTQNDLRNCAYIRMNLSNKEVAVLMNITPKSAKMNRYRLKKKLALAEGDDLNGFVLGLVD